MSTSNVIDILTRQPIGGGKHEWEGLPGPTECLACFVHRMVVVHGCSDGLHWVARWRELRSPRATALSRRLERRGGVCDCAVVGLVWSPSAGLWEWDEHSGARILPLELPSCAGVRRTSTQPCGHWATPQEAAL